MFSILNKKNILRIFSIFLLTGVGFFFQNCAEIATPESEFMLTDDNHENILCNVPNGQGERVWNNGVLGPCEVKFCNVNHRLENNLCVFSASSCPINHGEGITESTGICRAISCNTNYSLYDNGCVKNKVSCPVPNGTGEKIWTGNAYGNCLAKTCNNGFTLSNDECQPILTTNIYFPRTVSLSIDRSSSLNLNLVAQQPIPFNTNVVFRVKTISTPERQRVDQFISGGISAGKTYSFQAIKTASNFNLNIPTNNNIRLTKPLSIEFEVASSQNLFPNSVTVNIKPSPTDIVDVSYQTTASGFKYCLGLTQNAELQYSASNCDSQFLNNPTNLRLNTATGSLVKNFQSVIGSQTFFYNEVKVSGQEQLIMKNQDITKVFQSNFIIRKFMAGNSHAVMLLGDRTKFAITSKASSSNVLTYFNSPVGALLDIAITNRNTENLFALGQDGRVHWLRYQFGTYRLFKTLDINPKVISLTGGLDHISMLTDNQQIHFVNVNTERQRSFTLPIYSYGIYKIVGSGNQLNIWYRDNAIRYYSIPTALESAQTPLGYIKSTQLQSYSGRRYYNPITNLFSLLNYQ